MRCLLATLLTIALTATTFVQTRPNSLFAPVPTLTLQSQVFASENFNRPNGAFANSIASGGGTWTQMTPTGGATITGNRLRAGNANLTVYRHSHVPSSANYTVKSDIFANDVSNITRIGPAVRVDQFGNCYDAYYFKNSNRFEIRKETGGTATTLPTSAVIATTPINSHTAVNGQTYVVELTAVGSQLSLKVDGVQVIAPFVNTAISAAGRPGIRASSNNTNFLLDNWEAIEGSGQPTPTPSPTSSPTPTVTPTPIPTPTPTPSSNTITVNPSVTYQTMVGWEASAQAGQDYPDWNLYKNSLMDQAVADGINRLRLAVTHNVEASTPNFNGSVNDNNDPHVINPAGFQWGNTNGVDGDIEVANLMRTRLAARGETLYVNAIYVDFRSAYTFDHHTNPEEYAELMEALFLRTATYGWVPDSIEVLLEADAISNIKWWKSDTATPSGAKLAAVIIATRNRLAAHGWFPKFIAPGTTNCDMADVFFNAMKAANPAIVPLMSELSYHRYGGGAGCTQAMVDQNRAVAEANGIALSMLERIGATYHTLHTDLKLNNNVAWQQFALGYDSAITGDDGSVYYLVNHTTHAVTIASRTKFLRQYFKFIRRGAIRIDATSTNPALDPVAFINSDGKWVVVVKATAGATFTIPNLPAATYGIKYTTGAQYDIDFPDQTGTQVITTIPAAGVITIYGR